MEEYLREQCVDKIHKYLDDKLKEYNVDENHLVLAGISMGGIVAKAVGLTRNKNCKGIFTAISLYFPVTIKSMPQLFYVYGTKNDDVIPNKIQELSYNHLKQQCNNLVYFSSNKDYGHSIGNEGFNFINQFICELFKW